MRGGTEIGIYEKKPRRLVIEFLGLRGGGYLLSHFRSIIGVARFNFSVRNGKRWSPCAIATLISLKKSDLEAVSLRIHSHFFATCFSFVSSESVWAISIARLNKLPVLTPATYLRLRLKRPF